MKYYIVIVLFLIIVGCDNNVMDPTMYEGYNGNSKWSTQYNCENYYLKMDSYLYRDGYGYYHMQFLDSYNQTFTTISAETGSIDYYQKVKFLSNKEIFLHDNWINLINSNSYTDENGIANGVISVWEQFVDDTVKIYAGYMDECDNQYIDSIQVIIN